MRKMHQTLVVSLAVVTLSGCATMLTSEQKREYHEFQAKGLVVKEKSPGTGAALGILPGGGSFYARAYGWGVVNLLMWPMSILWDPVSGYQGSMTINYYATKTHVESKVRNEIGHLDDQLVTGLVTKEEYVQKKREIENRYGTY